MKVALGLILALFMSMNSQAHDHDAQTAESIVEESTISIPLGQRPKKDVNTPHRGQSKTQVAASFGNALKEYPAKGDPAITRWDYPEFSVYFEGKFVIHSVIRHNGQH